MLTNSLTKIFISLTLCALIGITINIKQVPYGVHPFNEAFGKTNSCKCVVFRLDDIQDLDFDREQIKIMDIFLSKKLPLTLGLIMNSFGNDTLLLNKISEGNNKGFI